MTFTDRAILTGLVLLAIPVLVHLLGRRRARCVELPTARFAEGAHAAARGRVWLKRAALLALRLAAVALAVLALAGPRLGGDGGAGGRWALVLDASPSMRATGGERSASDRAGQSASDRAGRTAFDRARDGCRHMLGTLDPMAKVTLALSDGRGAEGSPEEVRRALEAMAEPSWRSDPLGGTIRAVLARHAAAGEGEPLRLVIATDATPAALADIEPEVFAQADADVAILVTPAEGPNAWVGLPRVTVEREDGRPVVCVEADAWTTDPEVAVTPTLRFRVGQRTSVSKARGLKGTHGRVRFRVQQPDEGPWQGDIRIRASSIGGFATSPSGLTVNVPGPEVDRLLIDNVGYFTATARPAVAVLVVDAADEGQARVRSADLVSAAFAGETGVAKTVRTRLAAEVTAGDLASADAVFWVGSAGPPAGVSLSAPSARATPLEARRAALVWVPADPAPPAPALAEAVGLAGAAVEAAPDGVTIDPAGYTADLLAAFEGGTSGDLAAPVFRQRLRVVDGAGESPGPSGPGHTGGPGRTDEPGHTGGAAAVVRFRDGAPAILERRDAQGRAVALAFGPAPAWGDLASRPEWVVLVHSLAEALGPAGSVRTLNLTMSEAVRAGLPGFRDEPGNFSGTDAQGRAVWYSVNLDPAETADLRPDAERLAAAFPEGRVRVENGELDARTAILGRQDGRSTDLAPYLVAALAAVLALEGAVAWWASPRRGSGKGAVAEDRT